MLETDLKENSADEKTTANDLYETHKKSVLWYISENFHPVEAVDRVLHGSPLEEEYEYNLRHLFGA